MLAKKLMGSAGGTAVDKLYVDDVFSTYLYTGNGSTQTITNGIDLAGEGGLVWTKSRNNGRMHRLVDTVRGVGTYGGYAVSSDSTNAQQEDWYGLTSFTSDGYVLGNDSGGGSAYNTTGDNYVSWTFRKAVKFFDVQTKAHTTGSASTVDLSTLGTVGQVIVKRTDSTGSWYVWHRSLTAGYNLYLEQTAAQFNTNAYLSVSGTTLTIASGMPTGTYVVYGFAHDTATDGLIQCGSFTTDGAGNATVTLGWEPQFVLWKASSAVGDWRIFDTMRAFNVGGQDYALKPNTSEAEYTAGNYGEPNATGFRFGTSASTTHIYLAIRRPNKPPTSGTQVYKGNAWSGTGGAITEGGTGFAPDMMLSLRRTSAAYNNLVVDRLRGFSSPTISLATENTAFEGTIANAVIELTNDGARFGSGVIQSQNATTIYAHHFFRRAPGFFDIVAYTGTGVAGLSVAHSLSTSAPELIIIKPRTQAGSWQVSSLFTATNYGQGTLETTGAFSTNLNYSTGTIYSKPTTTNFVVTAVGGVNSNTINYVAYLFATLPGISKVGSYTGNGSSQTINCGFSTGARFILIKRTDSTGDWYVWDSVRGIVAANDPHLSLNTTAAEVTTDDSVDPDSTGFIVNQVAATNINVTSASYIFLAIA